MKRAKLLATVIVSAVFFSLLSVPAMAADTGYRKIVSVEVQEDSDIAVYLQDKGWYTAKDGTVPAKELLALLLTALAAEREVKLYYKSSGTFYKARVH